MTNDQIESLAKFALEILKEFPDLSSYDGGDLQDLAVKHKLLVPQTVYAPCSDEWCSCAEFYSDEEFKEGVTCYHIADWLDRSAEQRNDAETPIPAASSICPSCGHMDGYHPEWCTADESPLP